MRVKVGYEIGISNEIDTLAIHRSVSGGLVFRLNHLNGEFFELSMTPEHMAGLANFMTDSMMLVSRDEAVRQVEREAKCLDRDRARRILEAIEEALADG